MNYITNNFLSVAPRDSRETENKKLESFFFTLKTSAISIKPLAEGQGWWCCDGGDRGSLAFAEEPA